MSLSVQRRPQRQVQAAVLTKPEALAERSASPLSQALVAAALAGHGLDGMGPVIVLDLALTEAGVAPEHRLLNASQERLREAMGLAQTELGLLSLDAGAIEGDVLTGDVESSAEQSAEGAASEANLSAVMRAALSVFRHAYGDAPPDVMRRVETMLGGGSPLASDQAERFGAVLGHDLSDVRVHVGAEVSALARALNAHAFTVGTDIFFGSGELSPGTPGGDRLLLHELTPLHPAQRVWRLALVLRGLGHTHVDLFALLALVQNGQLDAHGHGGRGLLGLEIFVEHERRGILADETLPLALAAARRARRLRRGSRPRGLRREAHRRRLPARLGHARRLHRRGVERDVADAAAAAAHRRGHRLPGRRVLRPLRQAGVVAGLGRGALPPAHAARRPP